MQPVKNTKSSLTMNLVVYKSSILVVTPNIMWFPPQLILSQLCILCLLPSNHPNVCTGVRLLSECAPNWSLAYQRCPFLSHFLTSPLLTVSSHILIFSTLKPDQLSVLLPIFFSPIVSIIYVFLLHIPAPTYNILITRPLISSPIVSYFSLSLSPFPFRLNSISYAVWRL